MRVALMALKNLIAVGPRSLEYAVVEKGLPKAVSNRALQRWDDADIPDLLAWMEEHLQAGIATLSSFERYRGELLSGSLTWAPMHESGAAQGGWLGLSWAVMVVPGLCSCVASLCSY